MKSIPETRRAH